MRNGAADKAVLSLDKEFETHIFVYAIIVRKEKRAAVVAAMND